MPYFCLFLLIYFFVQIVGKRVYHFAFSFPFLFQYISLLMDWIESLINNEEIFPIDKGKHNIPLSYSMP